MKQHTDGPTTIARACVCVAVLAAAQLTLLAPAGAQAVQDVATPFRKAPALPAAPYLPLAPYKAPVAATEASASPVSLAPLVAAPLRPAAKRWEVLTSDVTLSKTLERWAITAGYRMKWDAARNFQIDAPTSFEGDFEGALADVLSTAGIRTSDYPLEACVYGNTPPLVRVTHQGEQARECAAVAALATPTK